MVPSTEPMHLDVHAPSGPIGCKLEYARAEKELINFALTLGILASEHERLTDRRRELVLRALLRRVVEIIGQERSFQGIQRKVQSFVTNEGLRRIGIDATRVCDLHSHGDSVRPVVRLTVRAAGCEPVVHMLQE